MRGERGAALLAALAALALLGWMAVAVLPTATGASTRAESAVERAQALRIAEAAVHRTIAAMANPAERLRLLRDGTVVEARFLDMPILLSVQDTGGLVDLGAAPLAVIGRLLGLTGADPATAERVIEAIGAARVRQPSPGLAEVFGVLDDAGAAALGEALPYATVESGRPTVDLWTAPAPALAAAAGIPLAEAQAFVARRAIAGRQAVAPGFDTALLGDDPSSPQARITATVETESGRRATVVAVVEVAPDASGRWKVLSWR